jgi:hypothetical protein
MSHRGQQQIRLKFNPEMFLYFRMYTDLVLFTLPVRSPKITTEFLKTLSVEAQDRMDCDDDGEEDTDFLVT